MKKKNRDKIKKEFIKKRYKRGRNIGGVDKGNERKKMYKIYRKKRKKHKQNKINMKRQSKRGKG